MFECEFCGCELSEPETHCPDCIEMLNASYEDMEKNWPEYHQPEEKV